ncbi:collectin-11 [Plakobranchus ocellatus]|uniref:Collectin-11 n=1 Tax=Plakobranchus ocellatus TaxID=259542 RepID=A0AAV4CBN9_9GAST|nr:collectin-11 [Plakobranchus ocellatus]
MLKFALVVVAIVFMCADPGLTDSVDDVCPPYIITGDKKYLQVHGNKCYFFHLYPFSERQYWDAQDTCEFSSGNLAMPKTEEINDFLVDALSGYNLTVEVFIGLDDMIIEGEFRWKDGSKLITQKFYNNFAPDTGIFRTRDTRNNDCVTLNSVTNTWQDIDCRRGFFRRLSDYKQERFFICEYEGKTVDSGTSSDDTPDTDSTDTATVDS